MIYEKRIISATIWGVIFGFISWGLVQIFGDVPLSGATAIIFSRALLGFVIGISIWKITWWLHGSLLGLFFSLPLGFIAIWVGFGWGGFALTLVTGIVFGFLIELLTAVAFKAEMRVGIKKEEKKEQ